MLQVLVYADNDNEGMNAVKKNAETVFGLKKTQKRPVFKNLVVKNTKTIF
jgi:hypothetical protein